ncbi:NADH-ubiquinone oxidoreductase-F iron-sulfur binding region domain-containing protein [Geotoga petraea]|jgi:NADH:ubiquinone oxidoreductase subunit F (NADH-binding)/(2Fe-2S) ferredoxin/NAD-dependent dihydropyrimidine dehydrogenase PreA subunit|uniref:4Fe-4S dicluster domain-containing protein n=1 Tax=Geotoga petraea TaxID=28234 RepID=A0A1G6N5Y2_9BACT|nr:NADH-ubiquinone oxidoreductase-F iron-sulfur binding region domain-containing protein [Geotoga petraea]MDK2945529.1 NADH-quinone oxidoreductase subunit [Geotoga sp.]TGG87234.1 4Fe-4S dicluster domain-containing protein [Geotoga petraea]SDC62834.1 NAD(P)-dependent iron-only hydrogenase diaphorase component flavoprotein [Geotoga petraea]
MANYKQFILVCGGTGCVSSGSGDIIDKFNEVLEKKDLKDSVQIVRTGCFGFCEQGPIVKFLPDNTFYVKVTENDVENIVEEHVIKGRRVKKLLYEEPENKEKLEESTQMPFYKKQVRMALRNAGAINPEDINEYIANDGYLALGKALKEMSRDEVIENLLESGLRGRGGGGFPSGLKWQFTKKAKGDKKYVVCNADEGDPGAFMDRSVLEGDPHSVIEGMALAGYAVGADEGIVYIRAEYPLAVQRLKTAINDAKEYGFLGENIFGTDFNFDIDIRLGAGAFVCGEETALMHSIEGYRGEPTTKPPFPANSGLWGKPTLINNVETLASVPLITLKGSEWFRKIGTEKSPGTKVFALAGAINNVGLVEVPMGTTLRDIVFEIGGGIRDNKAFKAVQTGGPSGGCIPSEYLDTPIDFDSLSAIGSMMGSGGMIVMDENSCMVDVSKFYLNFTVEESCGKCTPCRIGNVRLLEILERITSGRGTHKDLKSLEDLGSVIKDSSLCGLGQTAPNPILSTYHYFKDEYIAHVDDKSCPAGACKSLVKYLISSEKCIGCTACVRVCPVEAIKGEIKKPHEIDQEKCIKCGACYQTCRFGAISKI